MESELTETHIREQRRTRGGERGSPELLCLFRCTDTPHPDATEREERRAEERMKRYTAKKSRGSTTGIRGSCLHTETRERPNAIYREETLSERMPREEEEEVSCAVTCIPNDDILEEILVRRHVEEVAREKTTRVSRLKRIIPPASFAG